MWLSYLRFMTTAAEYSTILTPGQHIIPVLHYYTICIPHQHENVGLCLLVYRWQSLYIASF